MASQLDYGNWVRTRKLLTLGLFAVTIGALIRAPLGFVNRAAMIVSFVFVSVSFLVPLYAM